jgi:hypothetical protein
MSRWGWIHQALPALEKMANLVVIAEQMKVERAVAQYFKNQSKLEPRSPFKKGALQFSQADPAMLMRAAEGLTDLGDDLANFAPLASAQRPKLAEQMRVELNL